MGTASGCGWRNRQPGRNVGCFQPCTGPCSDCRADPPNSLHKEFAIREGGVKSLDPTHPLLPSSGWQACVRRGGAPTPAPYANQPPRRTLRIWASWVSKGSIGSSPPPPYASSICCCQGMVVVFGCASRAFPCWQLAWPIQFTKLQGRRRREMKTRVRMR